MDDIQACIYSILADAVYKNDNKADLGNSDTLCVLTKNCNIMMTSDLEEKVPMFYIGINNLREVDVLSEEPDTKDLDECGFLWYCNKDQNKTRCFWQENGVIRKGDMLGMPIVVEREVEGLDA